MSAPDRVWFEQSLRPRTSIALSILLVSSFVHVFFAFFFAGLNGLGTALFGTDSTVLSARVKRSAASGPSIISGWGFIVSIVTLFVETRRKLLHKAAHTAQHLKRLRRIVLASGMEIGR